MQLTHEHEELKRNLKRFIVEEINPHVDAWEAAEIFPAHEVFGKLGALGYLGLTKPQAYGGSGLDYSYSVVMAEALGHISCGALPMAIGVQTDMATPALARFGSAALCDEFWRPPSAARPWHALAYRNRMQAPMYRPSKPRHAKTEMTTSSTAARCGSPTVCKPTGCACWPTPAKGLHTKTKA
jgi:hypothetical protein